MASCVEKLAYGNRLAAETALAIARNQWRLNQRRAGQPPVRVYLCVGGCLHWHLTHKKNNDA